MIRRDPVTMIALGLLVGLAALSLASPLVGSLLGQDPNAVDLLARFQSPSAEHLLGTDDIGRDVLLRLLFVFTVDMRGVEVRGRRWLGACACLRWRSVKPGLCRADAELDPYAVNDLALRVLHPH